MYRSGAWYSPSADSSANTIKVEKDLATISNYPRNEESECSTLEKNGKKKKETKSDKKYRVILQL